MSSALQAQSLRLSPGLALRPQTPVAFDHVRVPSPAVWAEHSATLADLGLGQPLVLSQRQPTHTLYFPVPTQLPVSHLHWELPFWYRGSASQGAWLSVVVNGRPVFNHRLVGSADRQVLSGRLGVEPNGNGFLKIEITLVPEGTGTDACSGIHQLDSLELEPSARMGFRYLVTPSITLGDAWALMPGAPTVLIPGGELQAGTYQAAWRVGDALFAAHKRVVFEAVTGPDRLVDTRQVVVPKALLVVPAFRALSYRREVLLADDAQFAAWVLLRLQAQPHPSVVVVDAAMAQALANGVGELEMQLKDTRVVVHAFGAWLRDRLGAVMNGALSSRVAVQAAGGGGVLVAGPDSSRAFGQLTDPKWASLVRASGPFWELQPETATGARELHFPELGMPVGPVMVSDQQESVGVIDLGNARLGGRVPREVVLDVVPSSDAKHAQLSVLLYFNDVLLAAKTTRMDGGTYRLSARVPPLALRPRNLVRVVYQRFLGSEGCSSPPAVVEVLPTSHVVLQSGKPGQSFTGASLALTVGGQVHVPQRYLQEPLRTLPNLIWVSRAMAVSPQHVVLGIHPVGSVDGWPRPFVAWDVPAGRGSGASRPRAMVAGMSGDGVAAAVASFGSVPSVYVDTVGAGVNFSTPITSLSHGSTAWMPVTGPAVELDPEGRAMDAHRSEWREPWLKRHLGWWLPLALVLAFVGLLVAASAKRRVGT